MTAEEWAKYIGAAIEAARADGFDVVNYEYNLISVQKYGKDWGYIHLDAD